MKIVVYVGGVTADNNLNVARMMEFGFDRVENVVGKGENADYKQFSPFSIMVPKGFSSGSSQLVIEC